MSTSLAAQLQRLAIPQATLFKDDKKKASLLFDPKEAALKDRDTFYEIGRSGLAELISLYEGFQVYEETLFSVSSKEFERSVQTKEVNKNLDQTIERFLLQLSPYLLLQSSHKALEWLINRYHIHEYNQDEIIALILPYHNTKIFIRFVQIMTDIKKKGSRWNWLLPVHKHGIALSKQVLYNQCVSNNATLQFIAKTTIKYVVLYGERATYLNTVYAFFCQTVIGMIDSTNKVTEGMISSLLPTIIKAIDSPITDFRASSYIILGYLFTKAQIKVDTLNDIVDKLLTTEFDLSFDVVLLIVMIYDNQKHNKKMSESILNDLSPDNMNTLCKHLKTLVQKKNKVYPFAIAFLSSVMPLIQNNSEEFMRFSKLPEILIDEVDLKNQQPKNIIKCVLDCYQPQKPKKPKVQDLNESDIEIIEEEGDEDNFDIKVFHWYGTLLKNLERQYPDAFDEVIKSEMNSHNNNKASVAKQKKLAKLLGFKPSIAHKVRGTYLFENLNHVNPQVRVQSVKYLEKEFDSIKKEDLDFLKESLINRLADDHPNVVEAVLDTSTEYLEEVLNEIDITNALVRICSNQEPLWKPVVEKAIVKFCDTEKMPVNQDVILTLVPYLFPDDEASAKVAWVIHKSKLGAKLKLQGIIKGPYEDNHTMIRDCVFKAFFEDNVVNFDDILDESSLNKERTTDICVYMLLKSCSFEKSSVDHISGILNLLLESVESRSIVMSADGKPFSKEIMPEFFREAKGDNMLFEVIEYLFSRVIEDMNVKSIPKPWVNVCQTPEMVLIRRLYEICVIGCAIPSYGENYVKLLQKLLNKFFENPREKFEFIANFACGHIFYATDPKDVIGPELQLRSLKLLSNFVAAQENAKWLFDSDVVIIMILLALNNPIKVIRECVLEIVNKLLMQDPDKNVIYARLLEELYESKAELLIDNNQVIQILHNILTRKDPKIKLFQRNCLLKLTSVFSPNVPSHIKASFIKIFDHFNNTTVFPLLVQALNPYEKILKEKSLDKKFVFDIYESNTFRAVYSHISEVTITTMEKNDVWSSIEVGLKEYRECIMLEDQAFTSPSVLIMKQIEEDTFKKVPENKRTDFVRLIASAGAVSNNPRIASVASKLMKKIHLNFADFKPILKEMLNVREPDLQGKKKKSSTSMLSYQLTETDEWRLGLAILEYVQNKKKMNIDNTFVSLLFQLLHKCLTFEEQSYVEYTKQLILSSLWYYCKKVSKETDVDIANSIKSVFNVELIVQCIRGTQNPQTHHHALILLSHAAYMLPEQVLHHTMEIFTFVGSSLLRHDDAYSFQIITRIIETLIPILVKLDKNVEEHSAKELERLQKRVVPVLRIFADVVLHVPEHRRLPLYKKLMETIGPSQFLWVLIALLLDAHVSHFNEDKKKGKTSSRTLADQEAPINRLDFGQSILLEFEPKVGLESFIKLILHIKSLPIQKDEDSMETETDPSEVYSVNGHTSNQLRHYKYACITFMNTCLASSRFIHHNSSAENVKEMELQYKTIIINILTFIQSISKISDEKTAKYWRVMLHHSYDLLDHTNNLLSAPMFLNVVRGLLSHTLQTVRRKSMELLNTKIQHNPEFLADVDRELLFSLIEPLLGIIKTIDDKEESVTENVAQELELNQLTALLSLKLLTRTLASDNPEPFKFVLETITDYTCNPNVSGNVMASVVLCLAELCSNLKAHALVSLRKFMPALIKVLKKQRKAETPELVLLSTVTAISKIVESLPLFLSPYLQKILYEYSILYAKWQNSDQEQVSVVVAKLANIKKKIAGAIPPRVLIPVVNETHQMLLSKENFDAIGPVMSVLADSFANVTAADFTALQQDLTSFFLNALQLRSDASDKNIDAKVIDSAEDEVVNALVSLVLKLSETSFRPFYFKIYDWAIRTNVEKQKDRAITFYRLSSAIAEKLKGLFVLFAGHFIKNASELLDSCNNSKTEETYFDTEEKCLTLVKYIIKTLHIVFLYDSQSFLNKDRFETLMQPVVDQLENTMDGIPSLKARAVEYIIPCVSQFAVATADDSLWKLLNYQILLKTRHNDAEIRLTALDCLVSMATQLGSSWLPLLAESVPFLAELLEDGDSRIETATKEAIRKLEQILGEPLEKYF